MEKLRPPPFNPYCAEPYLESFPVSSETFLEKVSNAALTVIKSIGAAIAAVAAGLYNLISSIFSSSSNNSSASTIDFQPYVIPEPSAPLWNPAWGAYPTHIKSL